MVKLEHAVKFLRLRGGDVNGDFEGVPTSQLAVFPGTTHFFGLARTDLVLDTVIPFLDAEGIDLARRRKVQGGPMMREREATGTLGRSPDFTGAPPCHAI